MNIPFLDGVVKEGRTHPYNMLAMVSLLAAVPYIALNYAKASDLQTLAKQVQTVQATVEQSAADNKRVALETQLRQIQSELFDLRRKVQDMRTANKPIDAIYFTRISSLESDQSKCERDIGALKP